MFSWLRDFFVKVENRVNEVKFNLKENCPGYYQYGDNEGCHFESYDCDNCKKGYLPNFILRPMVERAIKRDEEAADKHYADL